MEPFHVTSTSTQNFSMGHEDLFCVLLDKSVNVFNWLIFLFLCETSNLFFLLHVGPCVSISNNFKKDEAIENGFENGVWFM